MIFAVTTCNHLCGSKVYLESKKDIFKHLDKVVQSTKEFRKKWTTDQLRLCGWTNRITRKEMEDSVFVLRIEDENAPKIKEAFCNGTTPINWSHLKLSIELAIRNEEERIRKANKQEQTNLLELNNDDNKRNLYRRIHSTGSEPASTADVSTQEKKKI